MLRNNADARISSLGYLWLNGVPSHVLFSLFQAPRWWWKVESRSVIRNAKNARGLGRERKFSDNSMYLMAHVD